MREHHERCVRLVVVIGVGLLVVTSAAQQARAERPAPVQAPSASAAVLTPTAQPTAAPPERATSPMAGGSEIVTALAWVPGGLVLFGVAAVLTIYPIIWVTFPWW